MRAWLVKVACLIVIASLFRGLGAQDQLFDQLQSLGVKLTDDAKVQLEPPLLKPQQASEEKKALLDKLAQRHGWERFSRNSPTAPVHVELSYVQSNSDKRVGHNIYSAFIAYAPLASLKDQELMASLFGSSSEDKELMGFDPQELPGDVLKKAGIDAANVGSQRYSTLRIPLMNRIVIDGTACIEKLEQAGSIVIAWQLDPHFTLVNAKSDLEELTSYANRYRKVERDELGKVKESAPVTYAGCGGYLCVTETGLAEDQLLIESRMAIHEPDEWFAGSNFLRSKLPAALQESAQSFRRKVGPKK